MGMNGKRESGILCISYKSIRFNEVLIRKEHPISYTVLKSNLTQNVQKEKVQTSQLTIYNI